jgi:hypothetical protein
LHAPSLCDNGVTWSIEDRNLADTSGNNVDAIEMCYVDSTVSGNKTCTATGSYVSLYDVPIVAGTFRMSSDVDSMSVTTAVVAGYNLMSMMHIGQVHPGFSQNNTASCVGDYDVVSEFTTASYLTATNNDFTKARLDNPKHEYSLTTPDCDTETAISTQQTRKNLALCTCEGLLTGSSPNATNLEFAHNSRTAKRGQQFHGLNKMSTSQSLNKAEDPLIARLHTQKVGASPSQCTIGTSVDSKVDGKAVLDPFNSFAVFTSEVNVAERGARIGVRPNVDAAMMYACLTPRTSPAAVTLGVRRSVSFVETADRGNAKGRKQLCASKDDILVYLHFGSKFDFEEYITRSDKGNYAVPGCTQARRAVPTATQNTANEVLNHGQDPTAATVFDLSENSVTGCRKVNKNIDSNGQCSDSGACKSWNPTTCYTQANHNQYSTSPECGCPSNSPQTNVTGELDVDKEIYGLDFMTKLAKVKANPLTFDRTAKYMMSLCERFLDDSSAMIRCTRTLDLKMFSGVAKAVQFNTLYIVDEIRNGNILNRRSTNGEIVHKTSDTLVIPLMEEEDTSKALVPAASARKLLQAAGGSAAGTAQATAPVPDCSNTGTVAGVNSPQGAINPLFCVANQCPATHAVTIIAQDQNGLSLTLTCVPNAATAPAPSPESSKSNQAMIWIALLLSIFGSMGICTICIYYGYIQHFAQKIIQTSSDIICDTL